MSISTRTQTSATSQTETATTETVTPTSVTTTPHTTTATSATSTSSTVTRSETSFSATSSTTAHSTSATTASTSQTTGSGTESSSTTLSTGTTTSTLTATTASDTSSVTTTATSGTSTATQSSTVTTPTQTTTTASTTTASTTTVSTGTTVTQVTETTATTTVTFPITAITGTVALSTVAPAELVADAAAVAALEQALAQSAGVPASICSVTLEVDGVSSGGSDDLFFGDGGEETSAPAGPQNVTASFMILLPGGEMAEQAASTVDALLATSISYVMAAFDAAMGSNSYDVNIFDFSCGVLDRTTTVTATSSTSTTTLPMELDVEPTILSSCSPLLVKAMLPPEAQTVSWECIPAGSALCDAFLAAAAVIAGGEALQQVTLSQATVASAATGLQSATTVEISARALDSSGDLVAIGAQSLEFTVGEQVVLQPAPGPMQFSMLDSHLRLEVVAQVCDTVGLDPSSMRLQWGWRLSNGSDSFTTLESSPDVAWSVLWTPLSTLGGPGDYTLRAALYGAPASAAIDFQVNIVDIGPPTAVLVAPVNATPACGSILDASGSSDPSGATLTFSWSCSATQSGAAVSREDLQNCQTLASQTAGSVLSVPGGALGNGDYLFGVSVSRAGASASAEAIVSFGWSELPVASVHQPPVAVSPQKEFGVGAVLVESAGCVAMAWKSWWLVPVANASAGLRLTQALSSTDHVVQPPLPTFGGRYVLRLVLSSDASASWLDGDLPGVHVYDSSPFDVRAPPTGGSCLIYPESGQVAITPFTLSSYDWASDDLPLLYRFASSSGNTTAGVAWEQLSSWSHDRHLQLVLFARAGLITIRAEVQDALGSTDEAFGAADVADASPTSEALLSALDRVAVAGGVYSVLLATIAVAEKIEFVEDDTIAQELLSDVERASSFGDPTDTSIHLVCVAINATVSGALSLNGTLLENTSLEMPAAERGVALVAGAAAAAAQLPTGLQQQDGDLLMSALRGLLRTVRENATEVVVPLSEQIQAAGEAVGDAVAVGMSAGETVAIGGSESSVLLTVSKRTSSESASSGVIAGRFVVPAEAFASSGRRLSTCSDVVVKATQWPANLFPFASSAISVDSGSIEDVLMLATGNEETAGVQCCTIDEDQVLSGTVSACGSPLEVSGLAQPVTFSIPAPQSLQVDVDEFRMCNAFNEDAMAWSANDCWATELTNDQVTCACNRLGYFAASRGFRPRAGGEDSGPNVAEIASAGLSALFKGSWWHDPPGILLWLTIFVHALVAAMAKYAYVGKKLPKPATSIDPTFDDSKLEVGKLDMGKLDMAKDLRSSQQPGTPAQPEMEPSPAPSPCATPVDTQPELYKVIKPKLSVWESPTSWVEVGTLRMGETVKAAGPPESVEGGYVMLPIEPSGALELRYLRPHHGGMEKAELFFIWVISRLLWVKADLLDLLYKPLAQAMKEQLLLKCLTMFVSVETKLHGKDAKALVEHKVRLRQQAAEERKAHRAASQDAEEKSEKLKVEDFEKLKVEDVHGGCEEQKGEEEQNGDEERGKEQHGEPRELETCEEGELPSGKEEPQREEKSSSVSLRATAGSGATAAGSYAAAGAVLQSVVARFAWVAEKPRIMFPIYLKALHPIWPLRYYSLDMSWRCRAVIAADETFGSLAWSALLVGSLGGDPGGDVLVAFLALLLGQLIVWSGRVWLAGSDKGYSISTCSAALLLGTGFLGLCIFIIMLSLANRNEEHADHWLLCLALHIALAWGLVPVALASLWTLGARRLVRRKELLQSAQVAMRGSLLSPESPRPGYVGEPEIPGFSNWVDDFFRSANFAQATADQLAEVKRIPSPPPLSSLPGRKEAWGGPTPQPPPDDPTVKLSPANIGAGVRVVQERGNSFLQWCSSTAASRTSDHRPETNSEVFRSEPESRRSSRQGPGSERQPESEMGVTAMCVRQGRPSVDLEIVDWEGAADGHASASSAAPQSGMPAALALDEVDWDPPPPPPDGPLSAGSVTHWANWPSTLNTGESPPTVASPVQQKHAAAQQRRSRKRAPGVASPPSAVGDPPATGPASPAGERRTGRQRLPPLRGHETSSVGSPRAGSPDGPASPASAASHGSPPSGASRGGRGSPASGGSNPQPPSASQAMESARREVDQPPPPAPLPPASFSERRRSPPAAQRSDQRGAARANLSVDSAAQLPARNPSKESAVSARQRSQSSPRQQLPPRTVSRPWR